VSRAIANGSDLIYARREHQDSTGPTRMDSCCDQQYVQVPKSPFGDHHLLEPSLVALAGGWRPGPCLPSLARSLGTLIPLIIVAQIEAG
jgi:hypothetical protein